MNCSIFRDLLDPYLEESLEEDRRTWFREHLQRCSTCRDWALNAEPSLLFAIAPRPDPDAARVEACVNAVTSQIRQQRLAKRLHGRRRPWLAAAAAAVLVIAGGLLWQVMPGPGGDSVLPVAESTAGEADGRTPPSVEVEMDGDDVRVYQFAADDSDTAVVFVVDPSLEL